ncbi:histone-lysine N-methyltransferase SETMAR [Trichonephila clavipes]|nr:histone-lysine N-methyltransferase SETMAR [Trichonephila clavipes]
MKDLICIRPPHSGDSLPLDLKSYQQENAWKLRLDNHGENASQVAEIVNGVYGADTVAADYVQFWFHRCRSGVSNVKDAPCTGSPIIENVDKITEIIEFDRHVSSCSIIQELKIDHKTVLKHLCKVGFRKKLDVWVLHQLTNMMDRISTCEALAKWNEIDPIGYLGMRIGSHTAILYENYRGQSTVNQLKRWPNQDKRPGRFY